ncbi:hypothetical protein NLJ89_g5398 [Agrocybe chaxingu]|uniref:Uncharacterized protein n=1 Tax=Agrocybe chaxingu TaxID=84603 RepID=A0A9W8MWY7_9AGAR|nr:hypothetical protein NLJ89_g5398 [Agrocybe chaxingu]
MFRGRFTHPDLDVLDSPLVSATPFTCTTGIPGSALAERIFNDPESWEDTDGEEGDYPEDIDADSLAWLTEEIEKIKAHSAGLEPHPSFAHASSDTKGATLMPPVSAVPQNVRESIRTGLKRRLTRKKSVRPISLAALFQPSDEDFSSDIQKQLSKILESGGIPHHIRPHPLSSALSPPSTSGSLTSNASSLDSPLQIQTASTVAHSNGGESPSPVAIYSASATLSFLEWYGIYPDSPRLDPSRQKSMRQKSVRQKGPALQVPSPKYPVRPSSLLSPTMTPTEALMPPPPKRGASVPPPESIQSGQATDLRPPTPPGLSRTPSPFHANEGAQASSAAHARSDSISRHRQLAHELLAHGSRSSSTSRERSAEASLAFPSTAPPPYTKTPSPQPPPSRSSSRTTNNSIVTSTTPFAAFPPSLQNRQRPLVRTLVQARHLNPNSKHDLPRLLRDVLLQRFLLLPRLWWSVPQRLPRTATPRRLRRSA